MLCPCGKPVVGYVIQHSNIWSQLTELDNKFIPVCKDHKKIAIANKITVYDQIPTDTCGNQLEQAKVLLPK
jgi:hypothetical protein